MLSPSAFLCAAALFCWPARCPETRLARLLHARRARLPRVPVRLACCLPVLVILPAAAFAGPAGAVAAALLVAAGWRQWRLRSRASDAIASARAMAEALRTMVAELRAGAHPAVAAESAATDAPAAAAAAMRAVAGSARLGGDLGAALAAATALDAASAGGRTSTPRPATGEFRCSPSTGHSGYQALSPAGALGGLTRAWALARRHGLPMAEVLDAVRRDLAATARFADQTRARMAGPRAGAFVLALLPAAGVALGEAMGAHPLRVLTATPPGQALLVIGCALIWAGTAWSARLTEPAVPR
ncbi:type II secretion system F family protein [Amycolatopsis anabasis]|uniref:type II secretion system F family protein n=1 Tax=Amycolatopsis anabasis TaxID=1840409 RepID=UPI00131AF35F|nr:hypothetical protein [Amycolatopsis anabasis]